MDSWDEESVDLSDNASENEESQNEEEKSESIKGKKRQKSKEPQNSKKVKYEPISNDSPKKGKKKNELHKPPTAEELNNLKETENLFNNNLFRLQIGELIKEVIIKNKRKKALDSWLDKFKSAINTLPEFDVSFSELGLIGTSKTKKLSKKQRFISLLTAKFDCNIRPETNQDLTLKFLKPDSFECFGLFENNSSPGPNLETSINVKIPKECFHVKDFLNNRYLIKRFYYLVYICENISAVKKTIVYHDHNILLPILSVQPTEDDKICVKIYVTPSEGYFKPSRFLPNSNNVKQDLFGADIKDIEVLKSTSTVLYNSALAHDITLSENSAYVKALLKEHTNVQEGIKLLCIWLKQRELQVGFGAFTETLVLYLVTYLLAKKKINNLMSSYQVIRNFWNLIVTMDLQKNPISLGDIKPDTLDVFSKSFDIVFMDITGCYNLAAFLSLEVFCKVKLECELAIKHLDDSRMESFHSLFLTKLPFCLQYDVLLDLSESLPFNDSFTVTDQEKSKNIGYDPFLYITHLSNLLQRGLHKRILNLVPRIEVQYSGEDEFPVKKVLFGMNLNPETAFNFLELGPPLSDHVEADEFRTFWKHLSSDRRFRDGSTHVAVYFKTNTIRGKRGIVKRIIKFLLTEKLNLKFKLYYDEFEEFLLNRKVVIPYPVGTNEESSLKIIKLADELGQKIRSFQMSLNITGIQGISDAFSYSEVFPPIAANFKPAVNVTEVKGKNVIFSDKKIGMIPRYVQPVELVLQLEHSSKWPNNLEAVKHVKTSFYIELSKMLQEAHNIISHVTKDYLEVFYQGLVFRYRLFVTKEIASMKKELTDAGVTKYADTLKTIEYEKRLNFLPKINGALKGLQLQYPSFGPGTALIKRWLRSQLIDDYHLPDIVINLLNASLYVNGTSFTESCIPQISFLRFLKFMSEFQWQLQPLVVNFNEEVSKGDILDLESKFQQNRDAVQPLYIITPYDQGQSVFTKRTPSKEILLRVQQLAESAMSLVINRIVEQNLFDIKSLFVPNMEGYNLLIHLRPLLNPRRHEHIENVGDSKIVLEKYVRHSSEKIPIVGFDPVQLYLKTLQENYGDIATFFHDTYGGSTIGVLWIPKAQEVKDFKVSHINGRKLVDGQLVLNLDAIIDDFYILGKSIVKWIEKK